MGKYGLAHDLEKIDLRRKNCSSCARSIPAPLPSVRIGVFGTWGVAGSSPDAGRELGKVAGSEEDAFLPLSDNGSVG